MIQKKIIIFFIASAAPIIIFSFFLQPVDIKDYNIITVSNNFLENLNDNQINKIMFDFSDSERMNWDYVPKSRKGISLKELTTNQYKLFEDLLRISLSKKGFTKTEGVLILENVLFELTGGSSFRDPGKYFISFFGKPDKLNPWGWRFEGHHLSLNFTVIKESIIVSTPLFFGANPAEVKDGTYKGLRVLKFEEDYAREFVKSLDKDQLKEAIIGKDAPGDIITENSERVDPINPKGISASRLNNNQMGILVRLLKEYIYNSRAELAEQKIFDLLTSDINKIHFAWAGGIEKSEPHYYRIQSNTFLIEYDNTQNNANHIHTVWRSFDNDFGEDLLKKHYIESHYE